jgi:hypothetical protein
MLKAGNGESNYRAPGEIVPYENRQIIPRKTLLAKFTRVSDDWARATLDKPLDRLSRIWLTAYHIKNPSALNPVRVQFADDKKGLSEGITNVYLTTNGYPTSIFLPNYQPGDSLYIGEWKYSDGNLKDIAIKIYDATDDTQITWDTAMFWFEYESLTWNN